MECTRPSGVCCVSCERSVRWSTAVVQVHCLSGSELVRWQCPSVDLRTVHRDLYPRAYARNAFNSLNRQVGLRNIQHLCLSLSPLVTNTYRHPANLYVGGETIKSSEGTTQGDPIAMPIYALGVLPLIQAVGVDGATQSWFADDSGAGGKLVKLRQWWDLLVEKGPSYGYYPNAEKTVLSVKPELYADAVQIFDGTGVTINTNGCRYLGAAIGSTDFTTAYVDGKIATMRDMDTAGQATGGDSHLAATGSVLCLHPRPPEQVDLPLPHHARSR